MIGQCAERIRPRLSRDIGMVALRVSAITSRVFASLRLIDF